MNGLDFTICSQVKLDKTKILARIGAGTNMTYGRYGPPADHTHRPQDVGAAPDSHWHTDIDTDIRAVKSDIRELRDRLSGQDDNVAELLDRIERYSLEAQLANSRLMQRLVRIEEALSLPYLDQSEEQQAATDLVTGVERVEEESP